MTSDRKARPPRQPRIGIALGSGIARGWAHIGVLKALEEVGIVPDIVCGTSIGAVIGGNYLIGRLDAFEAWARRLTGVGMLRYLDIRLGGGGVFGGRRLKALMQETLGDWRIEDLRAPFVAVATDLATGHEVWVKEGPLVDAVMASYALPGAFAPVKVDGRWLIDGALVNPVPVSVCRALGARLVIAVNLNADVFGKTQVTEGDNELVARIGVSSDDEADEHAAHARPVNMVMRQLFGHSVNAPSMLSNMVAALNIVQDRLCRSRLAGDPPDVTVAPRLGHIGLLEFHRAAECIDEGRAALERTMPRLSHALAVLADWPGPGRPRTRTFLSRDR